MIIAHNQAAINTMNNLNVKSKKSFNAAEKLSSGYRINKASDDAAGLSISEKLRAQIRGLNMAETNAQDGISLIQTAEGAMGEIHSIQQRIRELCVLGANDTLVDSDRINIQEELNQLKQEINHIAESTEFNTKKLLDGSQEIQDYTPLGLEWKAVFDYPNKLTAIVATNDGGMIVGGTSDQWASHHSQPNDRSPYLSKLDSNGNVEWSLNIPKDGEYNIVYDIKEQQDGNFILSTRSDYEASPGSWYNKNIFYQIDEKGNILTKINGADNDTYCINQNQDGSYVETGSEGDNFFVRLYDKDMKAIDYKTYDYLPAHFRAGTDIKQTSDGGYILAGQENQLSDSYGLVVKLNPDLTIAWEQKIINDSFSSVVQLDDGDFMVLGNDLYKFDSSGNYSLINNASYQMDNNLESSNRIQKTLDGNYLIGSGDKWGSNQNKLYKVDANGAELWQIPMSNENFHLVSCSILENGDYIALGENQVFKFTREDYIPAQEGIYLQIGANTGQSMRISIDSMKPGNLGYTNGLPSVIPRENAGLSLSVVDVSISKVSLARSKLGAAQNALEHIISNVSNTSENLTNSESRIRDTDMEREIVQWSGYNLLVQASQAMLAQANHMPLQILELLK